MLKGVGCGRGVWHAYNYNAHHPPATLEVSKLDRARGYDDNDTSTNNPHIFTVPSVFAPFFLTQANYALWQSSHSIRRHGPALLHVLHPLAPQDTHPASAAMKGRSRTSRSDDTDTDSLHGAPVRSASAGLLNGYEGGGGGGERGGGVHPGRRRSSIFDEDDDDQEPSAPTVCKRARGKGERSFVRVCLCRFAWCVAGAPSVISREPQRCAGVCNPDPLIRRCHGQVALPPRRRPLTPFGAPRRAHRDQPGLLYRSSLHLRGKTTTTGMQPTCLAILSLSLCVKVSVSLIRVERSESDLPPAFLKDPSTKGTSSSSSSGQAVRPPTPKGSPTVHRLVLMEEGQCVIHQLATQMTVYVPPTCPPTFETDMGIEEPAKKSRESLYVYLWVCLSMLCAVSVSYALRFRFVSPGDEPQAMIGEGPD